MREGRRGGREGREGRAEGGGGGAGEGGEIGQAGTMIQKSFKINLKVLQQLCNSHPKSIDTMHSQVLHNCVLVSTRPYDETSHSFLNNSRLSY